MLLLIVLCVLTVPTIGHAQDEGWPLVERCVPPPTEPPADWTYDGTILAYGWAGIHGITQDFDTPIVQIFNDYGWYFNDSGLSPDGEFFAVDMAEITTGGISIAAEIYEVRVYSTQSGLLVSKVPWYLERLGYYSADAFNSIQWLDNQAIAFRHDLILETPGFENVKLNPFTGDIELLTDIFPPDAAYRFYPSPDWSRSVSLPYNTSDTWFVHNLQNGDELKSFNTHRFSMVDWKNVSNLFVFEQSSAISGSNVSLVLFHREAQPVETIFTMQRPDNAGQGFNFAYFTHSWSQDDRYFAFVPYPRMDGSGYLHLADNETKTIINTCVQIGNSGAIWLGPEYQLAVMQAGPGQRAVYIFDLDRWQFFRVAYHSSRLIGWRADD